MPPRRGRAAAAQTGRPASQRAAELNDLTDEHLAAVFASVPSITRRELPLVCRRWSAVCQDPSVWRDVSLDLTQDPLDTEAMFRWLAARRTAIRDLTLVLEIADDWMAGALVLGMLGASLERLHVLAGPEGFEDHSLAWLAIMPGLRELSLDYSGGVWLQEATAFPPGLEKLTLRRVGHITTAHFSITRLPDGLTRLTALRQLCLPRLELARWGWHSIQVHELLALVPLTSLERLDLRGSRLTWGLPGELSALTRLSALVLRRCTLPNREPDVSLPDRLNKLDAALAVLPMLPALAELDMSGCGLEALPAPVAAVSTLHTLLLAHNTFSDSKGLPQGPWLSRLAHLSVDDNQGGGRACTLPKALFTCSRLERLSYVVEGSKLGNAEKDLRRLLDAHPGMRELRLSSDAAVSARFLRRVATDFPKARVIMVPAGQGEALTESDEGSDFSASETDSEGWGSESSDGEGGSGDSGGSSGSGESGSDEGEEGW